jgi:hypothetical protein
MKTLTLNVQDSFVQDFLTIIDQYKDKVELQKDKNLENDPYFYERQKELHQIRNDIKNGQSELILFEDFAQRTSQLEKELELKYAH